MKRRSLADAQCPVARTLDIVGDPWTLLIVRDAMWGRRRFNEFQESLGIPRTTLTSRLALLVDAVGDVMELTEDNFENPPDTVPMAVRALIQGVHKLDHKILHVVDAEPAGAAQAAHLAAA